MYVRMYQRYYTHALSPKQALEHATQIHTHTNGVGKLGQQWNHSMVCYHTKVLLVLGNLGQCSTDTGQHLCLGGLQQTHNQLKAPHKGANQLPRVLEDENRMFSHI